MEAARRLKICFVCTHSLTLTTLYKGLFPYLAERGFDIDAVVGDTEYRDFPERHFGKFRLHVVPMQRTPSALSDLGSLLRMIWFFATHRYDLIHISTPKASLLASIAARLTFNGPLLFVHRRKIYELYGGRKRAFYIAVDRLICRLSRAVAPISRELGDDLVREKQCPPPKLRFFGSGSSNGIDVDRFRLTAPLAARGAALRAELGIPAQAPLLLFLGRMCKEKGADHLPGVFDRVRAAVPEVRMIVAGPDDARDPIEPAAAARFESDPAIRRLGFVAEPEALYAACDVFVFPSYFEGFGNVLLEAAAAERPAVAFDVPGVREAVAHGVSGFLGPVRDEEQMAAHITRLLLDTELRRRMSAAARARVVAEYRRERIWGEIEALLREMARKPAAA
jgi:glycosyltransferase involved in cell wall biosynthesis